MDVLKTLGELGQLTQLLSIGVHVDTDEEWAHLQQVADALNAEAERCHLPTAKVREETRRLRRHLGAALGKDDLDGHPRSQHLSWTWAAIGGLESDHCFGPLLTSVDLTKAELKA